MCWNTLQVLAKSVIGICVGHFLSFGVQVWFTKACSVNKCKKFLEKFGTFMIKAMDDIHILNK